MKKRQESYLYSGLVFKKARILPLKKKPRFTVNGINGEKHESNHESLNK